MALSTHMFLLSSLVVSTASGAGFLENRGPGGFDLLHELESLGGRDHRVATENRIGRLEEALKPLFKAMPKDAQGNVDATSTKYLLHRLFVQRHGWFVHGLNNAGESWNSSSPAAVFEAHAEEHHALFTDRLSSHGFSLHQVAVFAATLETLVHGESLERLETSYRLLGFRRSESLTEEEAQKAIRTYMLIYNQKPDSIPLSALTRRHLDIMDRTAGSLYKTWSETQKFVQGIRQRVLEDVASDERTTWETNLKVVEEIAERHGRWQDQDCHQLKGMLMDLEQPGTGRVRVTDFWKNRLNNKSWNFVESAPYLRQLGALDETDPEQPSVIITNYLISPSNCVSGSRFYSVCCIDQCENILGVLEQKVAQPYATPAKILELVSALPSDTVEAPHMVSAALTGRLEEIATHHGGRVPLHGRLFAQWLHHAYPHECPFPHVSGSTKPMSPETWMSSEVHGNTPMEVGEDEIRRLLEESRLSERTSDTADEQAALPWHAEEELFVSSPQLPKAESSISGTFSWGCALMVFPLSAALALGLRSYASTSKKSSAGYSSNHKYYV